MTSTKLYEIRDYSHEPGWVSYVSEDTISLQDCWTTTVPVDKKELEKCVELPTAPKQFTKKIEAKEYLDALKSARLQDWNKNGWYYKANGRQKPQWKIYPVTVPQVAQELVSAA
jgi:hypothetical protein